MRESDDSYASFPSEQSRDPVSDIYRWTRVRRKLRAGRPDRKLFSDDLKHLDLGLLTSGRSSFMAEDRGNGYMLT